MCLVFKRRSINTQVIKGLIPYHLRIYSKNMIVLGLIYLISKNHCYNKKLKVLKDEIQV